VCVCVCVCARACVRARAHLCVRVSLCARARVRACVWAGAGSPHLLFFKAMESEHLKRAGCDEEFETLNYHIKRCGASYRQATTADTWK
jgi:hypothetical protein